MRLAPDVTVPRDATYNAAPEVTLRHYTVSYYLNLRDVVVLDILRHPSPHLLLCYSWQQTKQLLIHVPVVLAVGKEAVDSLTVSVLNEDSCQHSIYLCLESHVSCHKY